MIIKFKKIALITLITAAFSPVYAEQIMKIDTVGGKALYYKQHTGAEFDAAGCDPAVYETMVQNYIKTRGNAHAMEYAARSNQSATQAPDAAAKSSSGSTASGGSCFSNAASQLKTTTDKIMNYFNYANGKTDRKEVEKKVLSDLANGACNEINRVTGKEVSDLMAKNPINIPDPVIKIGTGNVSSTVNVLDHTTPTNVANPVISDPNSVGFSAQTIDKLIQGGGVQ